MYYDWDGNPITAGQWSAAFMEERHVGNDVVYGINISTVYIGINHRFDDDGPPLIFETMVFGGDMDGEMWRYGTREEALAGHQVAVSLVEEAARKALHETRDEMRKSR